MTRPDPVAVHRRALVLERRCPGCAERVGPAELFRSRACRHCGAALGDFGLFGHALVESLERSSRRGFIVVAAAVGLTHLVLGWVPLLDAAVLVLAAIWIRFAVLNPATDAMEPRRRVITRLTARLWAGTLIAAVLVLSQLLTLVGVFGLPVKAVIGAAVVVASVFVIRRYALWQLGRESAGRKVEAWEYAVLALSAGIVIAAVGALVFAVFAVASTLSGWLGGGA